MGTIKELLQLFDQIPSPNLAANVDLGHAFLCDPQPFQAIRELGDKIVHCHISNMPLGKHDHLIPQEGDMDLDAYLQALAATGFDRVLALDLYKYDYETVASAPSAIFMDC
ncbi:MAG: sugar phosphate isomerase/epimerase family protein [Anaerolineales bacterium]